MKLLIILSVIAYGYTDKLDRTYLPPQNAQTAGGSPGALTAPGAQSGSFGQGLPSSPGSFVQSQPSGPQSGSVNFGQQGAANRPTFGPSGYGQVSGPSGSGVGNTDQVSFSASKGQTGFSSGSSGFGQSGADGIQSRPTFGPSGFGQPSNALGSSSSGAQKNGFSFPKGVSEQKFSPVSGSPSNGYDSFQSGITQSNGQPAGGSFNQAFGAGPTTYQAPQPERPQAAADRNAGILKYVNENDGESYNYSYETSNGISAEEAGVATNGVSAQGGYAYTGDDGYKYSVTYTADENGYQPQGDHLPTPPPIPAEILKSIEENARAAAAGTQEGAYRPEQYETEGSPQQYNAGASSYNQPQSQIQGYPQGQRNNMIQSGSIFANQGNSGQGIDSSPSQFGQVQPNKGFNQVSIESNGLQGQSIKQSGQNFGQNSQTFERGQANSYQYNQPQNSFGLSNAAQADRQIINAQKPTSYSRGPSQSFGLSNQGASTSLQETGPFNAPQGAQGISKTGLLPTGTFRPSGSTYQTSGTNTPSSQLGSAGPIGTSRPSGSSGALEPNGPTKSFGQGQPSSGSNQQSFATNQPSIGASQPFKQTFGSSSSAQQGYQYGLNGNQPAFGNEITQGARPTSSFNQGSQQFGNIPSKSNFGSSQVQAGRPQYQENGNKPSLETKIPSSGSQSTPFGQFGPGVAGSSAGSQNGLINPAGSPQNQQNGNQPSFGGNVPSQGSQLTPSGQYRPLSGPRDSQLNQRSSFGSAPSQGTRGSEFGGPRQQPSFSPQEGYKY